MRKTTRFSGKDMPLYKTQIELPELAESD